MHLFETASQFSLYIEELAAQKAAPYVEVISEFCDENLIEYTDVVKMISPVLKQKIKDQCRETYAMPQETTTTLE
jgi:hypothetical protein